MLTNWWQNKSLILLLFIGLCIFSCKSGSDELSGNIQPDDERLGTYFIDTMKLKTSIMLFDSVRTNDSYRMLFGAYNDSLLGRVEARTFAQFNVINTVNTLGPNPKLDKIYFYLVVTSTGFSKYYYGLPNTINKFTVHRLKENIPFREIYGNESLSYDPLPLGSGTITDSDSTIKIELAKEFGQEMIDNPTIFSSNSSFVERFKGLVLVGSSTDERVWGVLVASIQLKYYNYYALNNLLITEDMNINVSSSINERFIQLNIDRSNTPYLKNLSKTYDSVTVLESGNECLIQGGTGVGTKVKFPGLENFIKSVKGKILINRAELEISPVNFQKSNYRMCPAIEVLLLAENGKIRKSSDAKIQYLQYDESNVYGSSNYISYKYDTLSNLYRVRLTTYIQAIVDGNIPNNGLFIKGAADNAGINLNRTIFYNDPFKSSYIRLKMYYSPYN